MSTVVVDTEKLAYGLEVGIGHTRSLFAAMSPELRLRTTCCGLVSTAIYEYCKYRKGMTAGLLISKPNLPFDEHMSHVVATVGEAGSTQKIVDASYSQFLGYVGLTAGYAEKLGEDVYPTEKVVDFKLSERDVMIDWLTDVSTAFREQYGEFSDLKYKEVYGQGPLREEPAARIKAAFETIWSPTNFVPWAPSSHVLASAQIVSEHIPSGAITITD